MLLKVCSRSQGQPRCGSRRRAISASSAPRARSASLIGGSDTHPIEGEEHPGGGAPDVAITVWDLAKLHLLAADRGSVAGPGGIWGVQKGKEGPPQDVPELPPIQQHLATPLPPGPPPRGGETPG